jgi:hypothetical protein
MDTSYTRLSTAHSVYSATNPVCFGYGFLVNFQILKMLILSKSAKSTLSCSKLGCHATVTVMISVVGKSLRIL